MEHLRLAKGQSLELKLNWTNLLRVVKDLGGENGECVSAGDGEEGNLGNEDGEDWSETNGERFGSS